MSKERVLLMKVFVTITYLIMISTNALANALPINGVGTGDVSDNYGNLFAPAALTFAIWGLIYILLFAFVVFYLIQINKINNELKVLLLKISFWFALSSIANTIWIFAWHYDLIWLTLILMIGILICLIIINLNLRNQTFNPKQLILIRIPFAVYFGWITVATIANTTTFLVWTNWSGFGLSEVIWADIIFIVGAIIGFAAILFYKSFSYGLVLIWAYSGIMIKHLSDTGFQGQYVSAIISVSLSLLLLILGLLLLYRSKKQRGLL